MNDFKATPECWEWQEKWASKEVPDEDSSCFLELRARVAKLEAQASSREVAKPARMVQLPTPSQIAECGGPCFESGREACDCGLRNDPAPVAGGLMERVAYAITGDSDGPINWKNEARAAIFEVARWLREQGTPASGWAMRIEQEAGR